MIIKSSQRGAAMELAAHLLKDRDVDGEEQIATVGMSRYLLPTQDVRHALQTMEMMSWASPRTQKHLYHASMNPDRSMSEEEWQTAWRVFEEEYALADRPFIEVTHDKKGRIHKHRVYERVNTEGKALRLSFTRVRNEKISRILEYELGHPLTVGKHNRTVMLRLQEEGRDDIVRWLEEGQAHAVERPTADMTYQDVQQERRTKVSKQDVKDTVLAAWQSTENGRQFEAIIATQRLVLARGYRRNRAHYVVVDAAGGTHSPRRMLGVKAKELFDRWVDVLPQQLPTVEQVQQEQSSAPQRTSQEDPDAIKEVLLEERAKVEEQIAQLEALLNGNALAESGVVEGDQYPDSEEVASEEPCGVLSKEDLNDEAFIHALLQTKIDVPEEALWMTQPDSVALEPIAHQMSENTDQREHIKELMHWQRQAGLREPGKPQRRTVQKAATASWGRTELQQVLTLQGPVAAAERDRRLMVLHKVPNERGIEFKSMEGLTAYRQAWQSRFKRTQGAGPSTASQRNYRLADRFILQRLARQGYSRRQAHRILLQMSPEVLNQRPTERLRYVRAMTHRVYDSYERNQRHLQADRPTSQTKPPAQHIEYKQPSNPEPELER